MDSAPPVRHQPLRAATAAFVGTMIEWYDFYIYAMAAALVFGKLFFPTTTGFHGTLAALGTFAVGFLARPLGGALFGHVGDRLGRKKSLVITLLLMGSVTVCIGLLPTYAQAGLLAPVALVALRLLQGVAVGGEWGGAVLMAGEHARAPEQRTFLASFAQLGSPAGLILATLMFKLVTGLDEADFLDWGWRVPFLFSALLLAVGLAVRVSVEESPEFLQAQARRKAQPGHGNGSPLPLLQVLRRQPGWLALGVGANVLGIAGFYFTNTFMLAYTTEHLHMPQALILNGLLVVSVLQFVLTPLSARVAQRMGQARFLVWMAAASLLSPYVMFTLVDQGTQASVTLGVGVAVAFIGAYYAVIAGYVSACFPTEVRYTGISMAYQLSGALFGGLTPMVGAVLAVRHPGQWWPLALMFSLLALISLLSVLGLSRRSRA